MDMIKNVIKAIDGDQEAISELYYATYPKLRAVAVSILKNEDDAEDIVQDSYIKAFSSLHQLDNAKRFEPWLCRIVSNKCKDYLKKNKPVLFSTQNEDDDSEPIEWSIEDESKEYNPEDVLISSDTRKQIMELLDSLPDEQRICLVYYVVQDMKISEIAELLEVSESTVKSRINYAKSKMQSKINDLEKKGVKLRGFAGFALFPFIRYLFSSESVSIPPISSQITASTAASASQATATAAETLSVSSTVIGETAKTVAGQAIKHLGIKIVSGIVAAVIAATTIAGIINPELLYPIDVFNIIEDAPIKVIERFEDGINNGDLPKVIECLTPDIQTEVNDGKYIADGFLGEFLNTDTNGVFGIITSLGNCDIVVDKDKSEIGANSAEIIANIKIDFLGIDGNTTETVFMEKIGGRWYIADNDTKNSQNDESLSNNSSNEALILYEELLRKAKTENGLDIAYYAYINLDDDGIPELLVSNADGTPDSWSSCEIYTYKAGKLHYCGETNSNYDYFYIVNDEYVLGKHRMGPQFISTQTVIQTTNYHWNEEMTRNDPAISYNGGEWEYITEEEFEFYCSMPDDTSVDNRFVKTVEPITLKYNSFAQPDFIE